MRLSTSTGDLNKRFCHEEVIRRLAAAGYDCLDFDLSQPWGEKNPAYGDNFRENARKIRSERAHV